MDTSKFFIVQDNRAGLVFKNIFCFFFFLTKNEVRHSLEFSRGEENLRIKEQRRAIFFLKFNMTTEILQRTA